MVWYYPVGPPDVYRFTNTAAGDLEVTVVRPDTPQTRGFAESWAANTWKRIRGGD